MEIRYRETRGDFVRWHRLNKTGVTSQWRSYFIVALTLLPTAFVLWMLQSTYAVLWMSIAASYMLLCTGYRYFVPLVRFPLSERSDTFDLHGATRECSNSIAQWKWERIEEIRETKKEFQFWRNDIGNLLPKHKLSPEQQEELRTLIAEVRQRPAGDSPPLPLYQDRVLNESRFPVYRYHMSSVDAEQIMGSKLRPYGDVDSSTARKPGTILRRLLRLLFGVLLALLVMRAAVGIPGIVGISLICLTPFLILWLIARVRSRMKVTRMFKLPSDEITARLCDDGLVMGAPDYLSLLHWSDVSGVLVSDHYIGFRTIHSLIHLLPMRVIGDQATVEQFLDTVIDLKDVADRKSAGVIQVVPVHSDNPYQAPMSE